MDVSVPSCCLVCTVKALFSFQDRGMIRAYLLESAFIDDGLLTQ
jgi:hypothetical protein